MATKQLSPAQKLMLEQAAKGPIVYEKLDGNGRRVAGPLEDLGYLVTEGENVEITDAGRSRLNGRKAHAKPKLKPATKPNGKHTPPPTGAVSDWVIAARADLEARHRRDLVDLDRLAGIRA